jgi:hypothetical protein
MTPASRVPRDLHGGEHLLLVPVEEKQQAQQQRRYTDSDENHDKSPSDALRSG